MYHTRAKAYTQPARLPSGGRAPRRLQLYVRVMCEMERAHVYTVKYCRCSQT